jgi:hypothetical protein
LTASSFHGRIGGDLLGHDLDVEALFGRVGGEILGFDSTGTLADTPLLLAGVVLAAAYYLHKERDQNHCCKRRSC